MAEKTLTLADEDWLVVDQALQQMPYGRVAQLYKRINAQFAEQQEPAEASAPAVVDAA